jgi:hypothetical protein
MVLVRLLARLCKMKKLILLTLLVFGILLSGCTGKSAEFGTLVGTVKIGPIWPVEQPGENPPVPPEVFIVRKVVIYEKTGNKVIREVEIRQIDQGQTGYYRVELSPGIYIVDINHLGIDYSSDVPKQVEIADGEVVNLDIDIDTGIR